MFLHLYLWSTLYLSVQHEPGKPVSCHSIIKVTKLWKSWYRAKLWMYTKSIWQCYPTVLLHIPWSSLQGLYCGKWELARFCQPGVLQWSPSLHAALHSGSFVSCLQLQAQKHVRKGAIFFFSSIWNHCLGFICVQSVTCQRHKMRQLMFRIVTWMSDSTVWFDYHK